MSDGVNIIDYHDLEVWKRSKALVKRIYALTKTFPKEEIFLLTSQIRRCAISIPSNIAEGHSRHGTKDFINFLSIAIGSAAELETQISIAIDLEYIKVSSCRDLLKELDIILKMLHKLRNKLKSKL